MALDTTDVRIASDGRIYVSPAGEAMPADVLAAPAAAWKELGYATDDGVTISPSLDVEEINAWQSAYPVRRVVTASTLEIGFTLLQTNNENLALYFNATTDTPGANGTTLHIPKAPTPLEKALLIEWRDGSDIYRLWVPKAALTDTGEVTLARGDAVGLEMTWTALPYGAGTDIATVLTPLTAVA